MESFANLMSTIGASDSGIDFVASLPVEIAEFILLKLDPRSMLNAAGVSRKWMAVCKGSSRLRRIARHHLRKEKRRMMTRQEIVAIKQRRTKGQIDSRSSKIQAHLAERASRQGMGSVGRNATGSATTTTTTTTTTTSSTTTSATTGPAGTTSTASLPDATPTLTEREQLKIEFYKTYDVMTGVRIAATLGGFFSLMVLLVVYKSRCKSSKQLEDPRLTAAAAAAVAEAEAEERALSAALEAIARLPPRPGRGPRRSLCIELNQPTIAPRFASVGGGYDALLAPPIRDSRLAPPDDHSRRCSSVTCSSTGSSYLERRGSAMVMPCLPPPTSYPRHAAYDEPWDHCYPIDIQVIQPTPDLSPCGSQIGLYGVGASCRRRAPLASMGSVDPPEPDSRSLGSDSVFLDEENESLGTEDEVSGFSTDSDAPGPSCRRFLRVPPRKKRPLERWNGCAGCVPRRRIGADQCQVCMTISAAVEAPRSPAISSTTSSSQSSAGSPPCSSPIELRHRPPAPLSTTPPIWSQETLF